MAFGFISDVVETIGDVVLGEKGSGQRTGRVAQIGATLAGVPPEVAAFAGKTASSYASGGGGQAATTTPTVQQRPVYAPESAMSGGDDGPMVYRPQVMPRTAGFAPRKTNFIPRLPSPTARDMGTAGAGAMAETILDIALPNFFGNGVCEQKMKKLVSFDKDGCPYVTRKQQAVLRKMLMYLPIEEVAYSAGVTTDDIARMVSKNFAPRRRGISASDMRTANRVNNKILRGASKLGYNLTPKSKADFNKGC
jgi:hypothetical protein